MVLLKSTDIKFFQTFLRVFHIALKEQDLRSRCTDRGGARPFSKGWHRLSLSIFQGGTHK